MGLYKLQKKTFVDGALRYPGDQVEIDPRVFAPPAPREDRRAALAPVPLNAEAAKALQAAVVPVAPVAPAAPGATRPQGMPAGSEQVGERFLAPTPADSPAVVDQLVSDTPENREAAAVAAAAVAQASDAKTLAETSTSPIDFNLFTMPKLREKLDRVKVEYESDANKARLVELAEANREQIAATEPADEPQ